MIWTGLCAFLSAGKGEKSREEVKVGFPRFKSKKNGLGSFRLTGAIHVFEKAIQSHAWECCA